MGAQLPGPPPVVAPYRLPALSNTTPPAGTDPSLVPPWKLYSTFSFHSAEAVEASTRMTMSNSGRRVAEGKRFLGVIATISWAGIPACPGAGTARVAAIVHRIA